MSGAASDSPSVPATPSRPAPGVAHPSPLSVRWVHGSASSRHRTDPPLQVYRHDDRTFVLRESKDVSFEAPFLYLFLGDERALLLDTGATSDPGRFPLRTTVDRLLNEATTSSVPGGLELLVAHSHGHGDHVAGDAQFAGRPRTQVVGRDAASVQQFFGFARWPEEVREVDLGGRTLQMFGIPGHHAASLAVYDPETHWLLTGDTVYPGRLYVREMTAFRSSLDRLVDFTATRPVSHVLGCHIEMTRTPRRDYPLGCRYQPNEPPLEMSVGQLLRVRDAARAVSDRPGAYWYEDFAIFHGPCRAAVMAELLRGLGANLRHRLLGS